MSQIDDVDEELDESIQQNRQVPETAETNQMQNNHVDE